MQEGISMDHRIQFPPVICRNNQNLSPAKEIKPLTHQLTQVVSVDGKILRFSSIQMQVQERERDDQLVMRVATLLFSLRKHPNKARLEAYQYNNTEETCTVSGYTTEKLESPDAQLTNTPSIHTSQTNYLQLHLIITELINIKLQALISFCVERTSKSSNIN